MRRGLLMVAAALLVAACGSDGPTAAVTPDPELPADASLLFVVRGGATIAGDRLTVDTPEVVEWFTDRPAQQAGFTTVDTFAGLWRATDFSTTPPNAAIAGDDLDATVVLNDVVVTDDGLDFTFTPIGDAPAEGDVGAISLFVDGTVGSCSTLALVFDSRRAVVVTVSASINKTFEIHWGDTSPSAPPETSTLIASPDVGDGSIAEQRYFYSNPGAYTIHVQESTFACDRYYDIDCGDSVCALEP